MPHDPLDALNRLRRLETRAARRHLAERLAALGAAEARLLAAEQAPAAEAAVQDPATYGAWLPRAMADRERARLVHRGSERLAEAAREALVAARSAGRAVELLLEHRAAAARAAAARREQALLDDLAARGPAG